MRELVRDPPVRFITFYSYKGGVGRTMALANVAWRLAHRHGLRVVAVDWDLEAPGLHAFFGLRDSDLARARGVLDFALEWKEALARRASTPPDVRDWLVPIVKAPHAPRHGSLSLLVAGRRDEGYDGRLAALDWGELYREHRGATAVETLRAQLAEVADVVLVDSRTGLTDAGGVCTVHVPDGVFLLTTANEQSLDGIERTARGIARATPEHRGGRPAPRVWVVVCRVPLVEESILAREWFRGHAEWFSRGVRDGLWRAGDHMSGLETFRLPHMGRWSFGEQLLHDQADVGPVDLLALAYDGVADLLITKVEAADGSAGGEGPEPERSIAALRKRLADAKARDDVAGINESLVSLARRLEETGESREATILLERAAGMYRSRGLLRPYAGSLLDLAPLYVSLGDVSKARDHTEEGAAILRRLASAEPGRADIQRDLSVSLNRLGDFQASLGNFGEARNLYEECLSIRRDLVEREPGRADYQRDVSVSCDKLGDVHLDVGNEAEARRLFEEGLAIARTLAKREPHRADYQRDVSVSLDRAGEAHLALGNGAEARRLYEECLSIRRSQVEREPDRADYQRDVSVSCIKLGDVHLALGNEAEARRLYEECLSIRRSQVEREPDRTDYQRDLAISCERVASISAEAEAVEWLDRAVDTRRTLWFRGREQAVLQRELALSLVQRGRARGEPEGVEDLAEAHGLLAPLRAEGRLEVQFHALADSLAERFGAP